jgi:pre-mRNA-splicing factor ATP-dependent RNA helicase DHX16
MIIPYVPTCHHSNKCRVSASTSKTPDALFSSLTASGLPNTPDAHLFINELFSRVPRKSKHKSSADNTRKQAEKEAKALNARRFEFLLEDEATPNVSEMKGKRREEGSSGKEKRKEDRGSGKEKRERHLRKRELDSREWESDEEEKHRKRRKSADVDTNADEEAMDIPEDEDERKERERVQDMKERDAFAERVREKDREKTKKVVEDRSSRNAGAAAEAAQRRQLADDAEARTHALPSLRLHSRQEYLTKREVQQIELLRKEIADEEAYFHGMKLTKQEQEDLERKKEILRLVEERLKINDKWDGYMLPEDYITEQGKIDKEKKQNALYKRYEEAKPKDDQFVTDVDQWEASQTLHSTFRTGAMDKREVPDDYEYVFDESQTIKFVMDQTLKGEGMMSAKDKILHQQIQEAEKRGQCLNPLSG